MEERTLDLIFLIRDMPFGFLVGRGVVFSNSLKLEFLSETK